MTDNPDRADETATWAGPGGANPGQQAGADRDPDTLDSTEVMDAEAIRRALSDD